MWLLNARHLEMVDRLSCRYAGSQIYTKYQLIGLTVPLLQTLHSIEAQQQLSVLPTRIRYEPNDPVAGLEVGRVPTQAQLPLQSLAPWWGLCGLLVVSIVATSSHTVSKAKRTEYFF